MALTGKKPEVSPEAMQRIFNVPEHETSSLIRIEQELSQNLQGFLTEHIVSGDLSPKQLERDFQSCAVPEDPVFVSEQVDFLLKKVVAQSVHTSSPNFVGHMTSAMPYFMLPLSKIMMALNQNVVKIETSKAFTPLELQVISMIHRLIYQQDDAFYKAHTHSREASLGTFCSGGTIANITALWVARNIAFSPRQNFPGIHKAGIIEALQQYGYKNFSIFVSELGHFSIRKACDLLGLGENQLVKIPVDNNFQINTKELEKQIQISREKNILPLAVIGVAGTTEVGSVDPLETLSEICLREKMWFHVDAAWGGPTLFSKAHGKLLKGIESADSVTIDAHKQLYTPIGAGICLFKDPKSLNSIEKSANYVIRKGSRDLGKRSLEGSRHGISMLVHSALRIFGRKGFELLIDEGIQKAKDFADLIKQNESFDLTSPPVLNLLTYRYIPEKVRQKLQESPELRVQILTEFSTYIDKVNIQLQKKQREAGHSFVSRTKIFQHETGLYSVVLRVALANPLTTLAILKEILIEQTLIAKSIEK